MPDLKRNLISLGMLDQIGCAVKIESDEIKIVKGSEDFIKGSRKNVVSVLDREVVTSKVGMPSNTNTDKTRLWHLG